MDFIENKFEISVGALIVVLLAGLFHLFGSFHGQASVDHDFVYEMPRPKTFQGADFDLSNREIDRDYVNPFVKKQAKDAVDGKQKPAQVVAKKAAAKTAAQAKKDADKKPQVTARVVGQEGGMGLSGTDSMGSGPYTAAGYGAPATNNTPATNNDETDNKDEKLSPAQWIALLSAQPTKANMNKLIDARNKGNVDSGTFNTIVADLLKNSNPDTQDVGLYGAQTFPDAQSFIVVAQNENTLSGSEKNKAETFLNSYTQPARLNSLVGALASSDVAVLEKVTSVILTGYAQAKSGTVNVDSRNGRGSVTTASVSSYHQFVAIFEQLSKSSDSAIVALANNALSILPPLAQTASL